VREKCSQDDSIHAQPVEIHAQPVEPNRNALTRWAYRRDIV
jgi:hypothetical protein